ncbi:MAG: hypothetical protein U9Q04_04225, partial [Campylobacterota bacterium]|nr:hypothetical protein [Campylobacterota bacterium]
EVEPEKITDIENKTDKLLEIDEPIEEISFLDSVVADENNITDSITLIEQYVIHLGKTRKQDIRYFRQVYNFKIDELYFEDSIDEIDAVDVYLIGFDTLEEAENRKSSIIPSLYEKSVIKQKKIPIKTKE